MSETQKNTPEQSGEFEPISINFPEIFRSFAKFWWLCLALVILGAGLMFCRNRINYTPMYESSVTFTVRTQEPGSAGIGISSYSFSYARSTASQLSSTFPAIIESNILHDIICNDMGLPYLPATLLASVVKGTNMFTITARGRDPGLTYNVLLSVIKNYPAVAQYVIGNTDLVILNPSELAAEPYNRFSYRSSMAKGALAGLALGIIWVVFYALCRSTVRSREDVRKKLNCHCIAALPEVSFKKYKTEIDRSVLLTNRKVSDSYLESFRALRNSIMSSSKIGRTIMLTSTAPGEGKTTVSVNLAIAVARTGKSVIVVDADVKNPSVNKLIGIPPYQPEPDDTRPGDITDVESLGISVMNFNTAAFDIWKLLGVEKLRELFGKLADIYDYVIIDTPPAGLTTEPSLVAQAADSIIMVVRHDTVRATRILEALDAVHYPGSAKLAGCVLNAIPDGYSDYGYGYRYSHYSYKYGYGRHYGRYGYGEHHDKADDVQTEPVEEPVADTPSESEAESIAETEE